MNTPDGATPLLGRPTRPMAALTAILAAALVHPGPAPAAVPNEEAEEAPRRETAAAEIEVPVFLRGVDLDLPAQEAFRDWPGTELLTRPYWLPWSWMSFQRANLFNRPVFMVLTVGWNDSARRMEADALADPRVLSVLNSGWTSIRVDADRRPEIRERYQTGSWPVLAFLLPNGLPMLSHVNRTGSAMPITASAVDAETLLFLLGEGRIYFDKWRTVLEEVGAVWAEREGGAEPVAAVVDEEASDQVARWLLAHADRRDGGIGLAPKFVVAGFAEYSALRDARLLPALMEHAVLTVGRIVESPLYDASAGGVRRMALAPDWKGIQPEKMLDKNAYLLRDALFVLRNRPSPEISQAVEQTARFLTGVLERPGGGFRLAVRAPGGPPEDESRVEPLVLAGPNSLAGAALLRAGAWLDDPALSDAGIAALELTLKAGFHRGRGVEHVIDARGSGRRFLETQSDVALAFVDAFETTGEQRWLRAARDIVDFAWANFRATGETALTDHLPDAVPIGILANPRRPLRPNTRLARAMVRLSIHGQGERYREDARAIVGSFAGSLIDYGVHAVETALAVEELIREPLIVRISGTGEQSAALRRAAVNLPWGWTVVTTAAPSEGEDVAAAEIVWRDATVRVGTSEELDAEVRRLSGLGSR